jgi:hypothetical protein
VECKLLVGAIPRFHAPKLHIHLGEKGYLVGVSSATKRSEIALFSPVGVESTAWLEVDDSQVTQSHQFVKSVCVRLKGSAREVSQTSIKTYPYLNSAIFLEFHEKSVGKVVEYWD